MRSVVVAVLVFAFAAFVCANTENGKNQQQGSVRSPRWRVRCTGLRRRVNNNPVVKKSESGVDKSFIQFGPISGALYIASRMASDAKEDIDRKRRERQDKEAKRKEENDIASLIRQLDNEKKKSKK
eukprot:TRINITY_DN371_c0_g3_i1.p1 TRINITY_DN371_c0_g3~~TRINITY_DN371_c0_g3_i1.p1  ORF type:complete len:126 (-),score=42.96 TRINITY_DN371_c0_g3_i1:53-430(-)